MRMTLKTSLCGFIFGIGILVFSCIAHAQGKASGVAKTGVAKSEVAKKSLAEQCAPDLAAATERVFANPGGKAWNEYPTAKQVPRFEGITGEMTIAVKNSSSGRRFVRMVEYGEGNARYQANCYDSGGKLVSFRYEMRTSWGWGYEDKRSFGSANKVLNQSIRFFDLTNNQEIKRPTEANDVPEFTKPSVYNNFDSLPIAGALKQKANATQK